VALNADLQVLTMPAATGNQTYSLAANFDPKAILLWATPQTADGAANSIAFGMGFATYKGGAVQQAYTAFRALTAAANSDLAFGGNTDAALVLHTQTAGLATRDLEVRLASMQTGATSNVVLNWVNRHTTASIRVFMLVLGGSDITDATVKNESLTGTAQDLRAAGFQPDLIFAMHNGAYLTDVADNSGFGFGFGLKGGTGQSFGMEMSDGSTNAQIAAQQRSDRMILAQYAVAASSASSLCSGRLDAAENWPSDGFRMLYDATIPFDCWMSYLAIKTTAQIAMGVNTAPTTGSPPAAQDNAAGFVPKVALVHGWSLPAGTAIDTTSTSLLGYGIGATDGTDEVYAGFTDDDAIGTMVSRSISSVGKILQNWTPVTPTLVSQADSSFVGNNLRLQWVAADTVARQYQWLVLGDAPTWTRFPTTPILDNLNRANTGPPPGPGWTSGLFGTPANEHGWVLQGNEMRPQGSYSSPQFASQYWSAPIASNDHEVYFTEAWDPAFANHELWARVSNPGTSGVSAYLVTFYHNGGVIQKYVSGAWTDLAGPFTTAFINSPTGMGLRVVGNTITVFVRLPNGQWQPISSATDSTLTTGTHIGVLGYDNNLSYDDFGGGAYVNPLSGTTTPISVGGTITPGPSADAYSIGKGLGSASSPPSGSVTPAGALSIAPVPVETVIDDFNRADGLVTAGAGSTIWAATRIDAATAVAIRTISNALGNTITGWQNGWTQAFYARNADLIADCVVKPTSGEFTLWFALRGAGATTFSGYALVLAIGATDTWTLRSYTNGVNDGTIASQASVPTLAAGGSIWVRKRGTALEFYRRPSGGDWTRVFAATSSLYDRSGSFGIELSDTTTRWDNLRGGPVAAAVSNPLSVAGTVTPASVVRRSLARTLTATITPAGALRRTWARTLTGLVTPAGVTVRVGTLIRAFAGTITPIGSEKRSLARRFTATLTPAGAAVRSLARTLTGLVTPGGATRRQTTRQAAGTITPAGAPIIRSLALHVGGTLTPAGSSNVVRPGVTRPLSVSGTLGGAVAFDPTALPGLAVWIDFAGCTHDGSQIVSWGHGGYAPDAIIEGTASGTPTWEMNELNGLSVARFSAGGGRLRIPGCGVTADWTVAYVARMRGPTAGRILSNISVGTGGNLLLGYWSGFEDVMYDNGFGIPDTRQTVTTAWKLYSGDGNSGATRARMFLDGVLLGTSNTALGWDNGFALSGFAATTPDESCDCDVAEVVMYDHQLTTVERQQVEAYLRAKWLVAPASTLAGELEVNQIIGALTYPLTPGGTLTPAGSVRRESTLHETASLAPAGAMRRATARTFGATLSQVGALAVPCTLRRSMAGSIAPAGALRRSLVRTLAGTATSTGVATRVVGHKVAGTITPTSTAGRAMARTLAGTLTPTGAALRATTHLIALGGSLAPAGDQRRTTTRLMGSTLVPGPSLLLRSLGNRLTTSGTVTSSGTVAVIRATGVVMGGTLTSGSVLRRATGKLAVGTVTPTGAETRKLTLSMTLTGVVAATGSVQRAITHKFAGTITPQGALAASRAYLRAVGGTLTSAGTIRSSVGKTNFAGTLLPTGALRSTLARTLTGTIAPAGEVVKATARRFSGTLTPSSVLTEGLAFVRSMGGTLAAAGAQALAVGKRLVALVSPEGDVDTTFTAAIPSEVLVPGFTQPVRFGVPTATQAIPSLVGVSASSLPTGRVGSVNGQRQPVAAPVATQTGRVSAAVSKTGIGSVTTTRRGQ
jgi:hypothetical protein